VEHRSAAPGTRRASFAIESGSNASRRGRAVLAQLRAASVDPAHGGNAGRKRSAVASRRHAEPRVASGRERVTVAEQAEYRREILRLLPEVSVNALSQATTLSKTYCSFIKRGLRTPHPRDWAALAGLE
jgi:hypothetical protein